MRAALWLLALFGVAVAIALFAGNNQGTVTLYWPPYRIDLSLNLSLLLLAAVFVTLHAALRALGLLLALPAEARRWRLQQKERAMHHALLDGLTHVMAGRYLRARKAAGLALAKEQALQEAGAPVPHGPQLRTLAHVVAADSAHALQDRTQRDQHLALGLEPNRLRATPTEQELHDGLLIRAARWRLDERDAPAALEQLRDLPQGPGRRTIALRIKLKAARLAGQTLSALETARLLAKHRAFSHHAAHSIVRGLASELLRQAHDPAQLSQVWHSLETSERAMPELTLEAAQRLNQLGGSKAQVREWLLPIWERWVAPGPSQEVGQLDDALVLKLVQVLEGALDATADAWLARIEAAREANPRDLRLQYLAGVACLQRQLWGKAQQLLGQCQAQLQDSDLHAQALCHLATLAEQRGDAEAAAQAWKQAALLR